MKIFCITFLVFFFSFGNANAQFASQQEAAYMATLKAVVDFKINDEENLTELQSLRENKWFNQKLADMMKKLSNKRAKNAVNNRIYKILLKAGKDIYNELN